MGLPERFWSKVEKISGGCWVWTGALNLEAIGAFAALLREMGR